ncbi:hypothetical protein LNKW23_02110 [Paralimibaculum aggregatum]|uniref:Uncharacterized protein n=1 Tax=Paralimibaculum aggregatum TaxID=3036245 RepID=A0ABQ6LK28_9RHOB|nr:DUF6324 family protein [Limibaculum sp. NKW23]GMG80999.1 hypothetical protein LNKW23_02110 [Limibaculum sp. NKW23]
MGIDSESEVAASLRIGPTTLGMVRVYVESDGLELPMDFDPDEAREIAEELRAAADRADALATASKGGGKAGRARKGAGSGGSERS